MSIAHLFHLRHEPPAAIDVWIVDIWPSRLFDSTLHVSHMLGESYEKKDAEKDDCVTIQGYTAMTCIFSEIL